jgi:uncharacterized protein YkwD
MQRPRKLLPIALTLATLVAGCWLTAAPAPAASAEPLASAAAHGSHRHSQRHSGRAACRSARARAHQRRRACRAASHRKSRPRHAGHGSRSTASAAPRPAAGERTAQLAAAVAAVLATPCQNTEITPAPDNLALVRAAVLCLVNRERAQSGESPLQISASLENAAEGHCTEMIADDYFAHVAPSGETPVDRLRQVGYLPGPSFGYVVGENLAWGTYTLATPQAIVDAWIASPGHLANILDARYTETGIGISAAVPASLGAGAPGATYGQEFGVIIG